MKVGVLALQGGWAAHIQAARALGHDAGPVRTAAELAACDGLILPGGESTTHLKLIDRFDLKGALDGHVAAGKPVLATCAGLILSARAVTHPAQASFGWLDVTVARNAWGRQVHSFEATADGSDLPLVFIRAPRILDLGPGVEVTHTFEGEPVGVRQGPFWGVAFHPELTADQRVHAQVFGRP
ncbi:MAG: pyridoxal 5'-phosphate synthase glutaminase subunit PdxT [Myxococcales bacterium]|nr:pyridoxal 5'-phosphate synthase glutaminase subunit PdxT [Myxococcales bacterium]